MVKSIDLGIKTYNKNNCIVFKGTHEAFGGLSNMAAGFPLRINSVDIKTSEALYQACRFPLKHDVQEIIIKEKSPMGAKMAGKPYREEFCRPDWNDLRIDIMWWCLRVKLAQNYVQFRLLLDKTESKPIVENNDRDIFWGAKIDKKNPDILSGTNALGCLLMDLRDFYRTFKNTEDLFIVEPLKIEDFLLYGKNIKVVDERSKYRTFIK